MRKILAVLLLLVCSIGNSWAAFDWSAFTPPPRTIPFTESGVVYDSFVQTRHPWYAQNYIVYYPAGISAGLKPVGVDYNQGAPYQHLWFLLNPTSQSQTYDSSDYNPDVIVYTCTGNAACGGNTWGSPVSSSQIRYRQYTWFDWNYAGPAGYDLQSDLMRAVGVDVKVNFGYAWGGQFGLPTLSANDVVVTGIATPATPSSVLSPVAGALETVSSDTNCSGLVWCFNQHGTGAHSSSGGVGNSNDTYAWDANLNYPNFNTDNGMPVYATASGTVVATYAGATNAGGTSGQVLIQHSHNGNKWWSGYVHLGSIAVSVGDNVTTSTQIGVVSNTGTGNAHLHFIIYTGNNTNGGLTSFNTTITQR